MAADLQFWHPDHLADAKGKLAWRHVNTVNTPVSSSTWLDDGTAIADVYELTFTKAGPVVSCTIECLIGGVKNPYRDMVGVTVTADGATPNTTVIPGIGLVFSASTDTGWKARVAVGNYLEDDGTYESFFAYGIVEAGNASVGQRVAVKNVGADAASTCVLYALPGTRHYGTDYEVFIAKIAPHTNPARHKLAVAGTYTITFADWKTDGGTGKKTADVYIDAVKAIEDAQFDGATVYQYGVSGYVDGADKLKGLQITLCDTVVDPSAASLSLVVSTEGYPWVEYAEDVSGAPGAYSNQDLALTESGEPAGTITVSGAAYFWHQWELPDAATAGAMRLMTQRIRGLTI